MGLGAALEQAERRAWPWVGEATPAHAGLLGPASYVATVVCALTGRRTLIAVQSRVKLKTI